MIIFRRIREEERDQLYKIIDTVINGLQHKEFFIPFSDKKLTNMFDNNKIIAYGAYDNEKLVGTAQLYLEDEHLEDIKRIINMKNKKILKFGGYLVLQEYRNQGIMKQLEEKLILEAKKLKFDYAIITVDPNNKPSKSVIKHVGAKLIKTVNIGNYLRNIYLLQLSVK